MFAVFLVVFHHHILPLMIYKNYTVLFICITAENRAELGRFAKNFLPIMLNILTSGDERNVQHLSILETIKVYLSVAETEVSEAVCYS